MNIFYFLFFKRLIFLYKEKKSFKILCKIKSFFKSREITVPNLKRSEEKLLLPQRKKKNDENSSEETSF